MTAKIFIDGEAGTTGLQIREKRAGFAGIELLGLAAQARKDVEAKRELPTNVDLTILRQPDSAAKEAAALIAAMGEKAPRVIDALCARPQAGRGIAFEKMR
jgi:N-acetyl-gamma-glutamyl-phosphate reductase